MQESHFMLINYFIINNFKIINFIGNINSINLQLKGWMQKPSEWRFLTDFCFQTKKKLAQIL